MLTLERWRQGFRCSRSSLSTSQVLSWPEQHETVSPKKQKKKGAEREEGNKGRKAGKGKEIL